MRDETEKSGAAFLLVNAPAPYEIYPDDWADLLRQVGFQPNGWDLDGPNKRLAALAAREGIRYLDLTPGLLRAAASGPRLYFAEDGHWTPRGHQLVAREIARELGQLAPFGS